LLCCCAIPDDVPDAGSLRCCCHVPHRYKEKADRLQQRCQDMRQELRDKSALVSQMVDARVVASAPTSSRMTPKRTGSQDAASEMNLRMKTLLEETLMKNVQLQGMVEALSQPGTPIKQPAGNS